MEPKYNVIILTTAKDFLRVKCNYPRMIQNMAPRKVIFIGNAEVGKLTEELVDELKIQARDRVGFVNEDDIIPFDEVHKVMMDCLGVSELARGVTGWYYQQFLKMQYSEVCEDEYYLVWDGDTVPCKQFSMFAADGVTPYLDLKKEYHEEYFKTLERLFPGMHKVIEKSFISEHMLMKKTIMQKLTEDIMKNDALQGDSFWERILRCIPSDKLRSNSFSEFETYGTYVAIKHTFDYRLRHWHSFRYAGEFFRPEEMTDEDYEWLSADFDAVSFEKNHFVRPDHDNLFNNKKYQQALSARKMLEIAQEEFKEGYIETWEESDNTKGENQNYEYQIYERLAEQYREENPDKAYLCYENAEFLCTEERQKEVLKGKKNSLLQEGLVTVKKVSIVIVSYNSKYLMEKCVESIRNSCPAEIYQIIVVDNASTDGVREWLQEQKDIKLISSDQNLGFPMGCNVGVEYSDSEADIFLLNNDTRLAHNSLFWLRMGLYENGKVGATGAVANYCGNEQQVDVEFSLPSEYLEYGAKVNVPCANPYEERNRLCGFAMLIRREAWNKIGNMDVNLSPGYFDDDDLSTRIREYGYRLYICHNSFIYHAGSQSFSKRDDLEQIVARNYYYLLDKWKFDIPTYSLANMKAIEKISVDKNATIKVLEIGAGCGSTLSRIQYLYPNAEVLGVEDNELAVEYAIDSVKIVKGDWQSGELPFETNYFDFIIYTKRKEQAIDKKTFGEQMAKYLRADRDYNGAILGDFVHEDNRILDVNESTDVNKEYYGTARTDLISMIDHLSTEEFSVLEVGCGTGATLQWIKEMFPKAQVHGVEINEQAVLASPKTANVQWGDIENQELKFEKHSFDYIIMGDVIEHLVNPEEILKYLKNFLKEKGSLLVSIPNAQHFSLVIPLLFGEFTYQEAGILDRTHVRFFTESSFRKLVETAGYQVAGMCKKYNETMNEPWIEKILEYICGMSSAINKDGFEVWQYHFKLTV